MQITLPPEAQAVVDREIASGRYETVEEVVVGALIRLDDDIPSVPADALQDALNQIEHGQTVPWTDDFLDRASIRARENARHGKPVKDEVKY